MADAQPLIELRQVTFGYGSEVIVDHVDLKVHARDYLALIGPNGGGKTTLLKIMLGLLRPWSGEVIRSLPKTRRGERPQMGYMPQFVTFDRSFPLRVADVVIMGRLGERGLLRRYTRADRRAADEALEMLHLAHLRHAPIGELSGGQLQRVLIARAIVSNPAILFLDEPTASIDAESRELLRSITEELNRRIPIVVVTHDITAIAPLAKQIACVNRKLYYHGDGELDQEALIEAYGYPVELLVHGVPRRVISDHC
jgi:zinc transport system ATP-binding protein